VSQALSIVTYRSPIPQSCVGTFIASPARKLFLVGFEAFEDLGIYHIVTSDFNIFCDILAIQYHNLLQNPIIADLILLAEFGNEIVMVTILRLILHAVSDTLPFKGSQVDDEVGTLRCSDYPTHHLQIIPDQSRKTEALLRVLMLEFVAEKVHFVILVVVPYVSVAPLPKDLLQLAVVVSMSSRCWQRHESGVVDDIVGQDHSVSRGDGLDLVHHIGIPGECSAYR
jgi:hypothetical protein